MLGLGLVTGVVHSLSLFYWTTVAMNQYGKIPLVISVFLLLLLALYLGSYVGLFGWALGSMENHSRHSSLFVIAPALWVVLEYLRSCLFTGFSWGLLGHSQYQSLLVIQISDVTGAAGVSFVVVFINVFLFSILRWALCRFEKSDAIPMKFPLLGGIITITLLAIVLGYGLSRLEDIRRRAEASPTIRVALLQGNIDQSQKWDPAFFRKTLATYQALTEKVSQENIDLVVWPETAVPGYYVPELQDSEIVRGIADSNDTPIIFGSLAYRRQGSNYRTFNSAFMVLPRHGTLYRYDKIHLVPFGEYVPLKRLLPFVDKLVEGIGEFAAGKEYPLFPVAGARCGVLICYEVIFPHYACAYAKRGANLLVNITNDAWFGRTGATYQHLSMAVFRAVETRLPLIRAANTGVSAIIGPTGKIHNQTPIFVETFLTGTIPVFRGTTFFVHYRKIFVLSCGLVVAFFALGTHIFQKRVDN